MYNDNYIIKNKLNIDYPIYIPLRLYIVNHSLFVHPNKYIDLYMATQRQPAPQTELSQIQHKKNILLMRVQQMKNVILPFSPY